MSAMMTLDQQERLQLIEKLKASHQKGKLNLHRASFCFSRAGIVLISERVKLLKEAGIPEDEAQTLGGMF